MIVAFGQRLRGALVQIGGIVIVTGALIASYLHGVLLFHSLTELIGVSISFGIFTIVWNTRLHFRRNSMNILGIPFLFVALLTLMHVLTYPGTNTMNAANSNLTTQFGIASRLLFAASILFAILYHERPPKDATVFGASLVVSLTIFVLILAGRFPACYVNGRGLTLFARLSDYVVVAISALTLWPVMKRWEQYEPGTAGPLSASIVLFVVSACISATYDNLFDWHFFLANVLKLASLYALYHALAYKRLLSPYQRMRTEIENRLAAEHQLRNSEEKFHSIFENAGSMIFIVDNSLVIVDCNAICVEKVGYAKEELCGRSFSGLVQVNSGEPMSLTDATLHADQSLGSFEVSMIKSDCSTFPVSITSSFGRTVSEGQGYTSLVVVDLTEHRRLEEQFLQSQKLESIGRLSGGVAHDFNNMATVVKGYSEMILRAYEGDATLSTWAQAILDATLRSATLSQELLAFSRKSVFNPANVDVNGVIEGLRKMIRSLLRDDIELSVTPSSAPAMVRVDRNRLEQVIVNLVINARDAMSDGGRLAIETETTRLTSQEIQELPGEAQAGPYVMVSVTDSGTGMEPGVLQSIFEPFFTTKPPNLGTGLGLSMVFGTVTQSRGTIRVESEPGKGSRFSFYLPRLPEATAANGAATKELADPSGSETILVVEDDERIMNVIKQVLPTLGYRLLTASNGKRAIEQIRSNGDLQIDLVVTDVIMPQMSGPDMAREIQKLLPLLKFLYVSGHSFNEIDLHGVLDRDFNYLQKPFSGLELARKIRTILDTE